MSACQTMPPTWIPIPSTPRSLTSYYSSLLSPSPPLHTFHDVLSLPSDDNDWSAALVHKEEGVDDGCYDAAGYILCCDVEITRGIAPILDKHEVAHSIPPTEAHISVEQTINNSCCLVAILNCILPYYTEHPPSRSCALGEYINRIEGCQTARERGAELSKCDFFHDVHSKISLEYSTASEVDSALSCHHHYIALLPTPSCGTLIIDGRENDGKARVISERVEKVLSIVGREGGAAFQVCRKKTG